MVVFGVPKAPDPDSTILRGFGFNIHANNANASTITMFIITIIIIKDLGFRLQGRLPKAPDPDSTLLQGALKGAVVGASTIS